MALAACSLWREVLPPSPDLLLPVQPCPARVSRSEVSGLPSCCSHGLSLSSGSLSSLDSSGRPPGGRPGVRGAGPQRSRPVLHVPSEALLPPPPLLRDLQPRWLCPLVPDSESLCGVQITLCGSSASLLIAPCCARACPVKTSILRFSDHLCHFRKAALET